MNNDHATLAPPPANNSALTKQSLTELVSGMLNDASKLIGQHVEMLKAEFQEDLQRTKDAGMYAGLGIVLMTVGGITLVAALVMFLAWMFPDMPMWAACAAVGGGFLALGVISGYAGKRMFESFNPLPDKTFNALQENLSWISKAPK